MTNNPAGLRTWPPARDAELRRLWALGWTASRIAERMGISRDAVIGRARRIGCAARPHPIKRTPGEKRAPKPRRLPRKPAQPLQAPAAPKLPARPAPAREPVRAATGTCRWTDSNGAPWVFCDAPCAGSWCEAHRARVFQKREAAE